MMRLECLSGRLEKLLMEPAPHCHQAWLTLHFELYDLLSSRSDIKNELLQELERHRQTLAKFEGQPSVASEKLQQVLQDIGGLQTSLADVPLRMGSHLPEIDFLTALKGRSGIPAGACAFDLPALHAWLMRPASERQTTMHGWLSPLRPLLAGAELCLRLIREVAEPIETVAENGLFETNPQGRPARLIRVWLDDSREMVCDMSANKYVVAIRFRLLTDKLQAQPVEGPVGFRYALCDF